MGGKMHKDQEVINQEVQASETLNEYEKMVYRLIELDLINLKMIYALLEEELA